MLKYSIRLFLQEEKTGADGKCPVRMYVLVHGKRITRTLGIKVRPRDWNAEKSQVKKSDLHYRKHNQTIRTTLDEVESKLQEAYNNKREINFALVKSILNGKQVNDNLLVFASEMIEDMKSKFGTGIIRIYNDTINHLTKFSGTIYFSQVDANWLRRYESHLRESGLANNTVHKHWKCLKRIFNTAIRESVTTNYPFRNYDNPKYKEPDRAWLTLEEVDAFEKKLNLPMDESILSSGYYFLLGCYSGLRYSDWARFSNDFIQGDRLILRAKKNGDLISIKIHKRLKRIIAILKKLPPVPEMATANNHVKAIGKLAGINKHISTHTGRHSFAVRCAELGISIETTAQLMGITVKSCSYYYKVTNRKIDKEFEVWNKL